ncbi:MAG TPA: L,D-transpeptidase [Solirubrobacteraceae bacterium]|nr:L,D-transpeptidase [Solirubrobacteraceae bacterium]
MRAARSILAASALVSALCWLQALPAEAAGTGGVPAASSEAPSTSPPPGGGEGAAAATPGEGASPPPAPAVPATEPLSNELTFTTWAEPEIRGWIHSRPDLGSPATARIQLLTSDGFAEVYVLLDSYVDGEGREWVKIRVPGRPNGRTGWVLRELLGGLHRTRWRIVVNLRWRHMRVYRAGRLQRVFPVGVGKPSTPTPTGRFWIRERFRVPDPSNPYWPYALGTSDYSTLSEWPGGGVVGIHGPYGEPQRIPGDPSHGCIRMLAPDVAWLARHVTLGTPVDVLAG